MSNMKVSWNLRLWIFCLLFGILFIIGTFIGNMNFNEAIINDTLTVIKQFKDLWANLLASMVVILIIERIVKKSRLEKNRQSVSFIRGRIARTLENLITSVKAPNDWKKNLDNPQFNWDSYYDGLIASRDVALEEFENIVDRYSYLLDSEPELINDMICFVSSLREFFDSRIRFPLPLWREWHFVHASQFAILFISESIKILQKYKLLQETFPQITSLPKEIAEVYPRPISFDEENTLKSYNSWLKEAISFNDEWRVRYDEG